MASEPIEPGHAGVPRWQQALLPSALRAAPHGRRSARDWFVDVAMFLLALAIGAAVLQDTWHSHNEPAAIVDLLLGTVACVALWWRRRHPVAVAAGTGLLAICFAFPAGAGLLALFSAALRVRARALVGLSLLAFAVAVVFPLFYPSQDEAYSTDVTVGVLLTIVVLGWGLFVRAQRELVRSLHERTARAESEQRLRVEQAQAAERRRIAREMHDVLAHRVSLLSLHAGALEFRPDAPPQEIAAAAGVVRANARAALEDLRAVIGVLREEGGDGAGAGRAPEPPQPTLARIPALVEQSRAAGMKIACHIDLAALGERTVGDALGRTAYRIVQEGLTNAHKHAPAAAVEVTVAARPAAGRAHGAELVVEVVSRPAVGRSPAAADESLPGTGTGLVGLRERVALADGELVHGPDDRGDFVLRAILPVVGAVA